MCSASHNVEIYFWPPSPSPSANNGAWFQYQAWLGLPMCVWVGNIETPKISSVPMFAEGVPPPPPHTRLRFTFAIWRAWANNGSNIRLDSESGGETSAAHHKQAGCSNTYSICWTSFLSPSPQLPRLSRQAVAGEGEEGVEWWKGRGRSCIRVNVGGEAANLESSPQLLWASGSFSAEKVKATECLSGCLVGGILK